MRKKTGMLFVVGITITFLFSVIGPVEAKEVRWHTRSIVAADPVEDAVGVAVVSWPSGTGAVVPIGVPGIAVANQSFPSYANAQAIIAAIQGGDDAQMALDNTLAADPLAAERQIGIAALDPLAPNGVSLATFTGANNIPETCSVVGDTYVVQANLQSSDAVCEAMADAYEAATGSLTIRLRKALIAGAKVGGDARGEYSPTVRVWSDSWLLASVTPVFAESVIGRAKDWQEELTFHLNAHMAVVTPGLPADNVELTRRRAQKIQRVLKHLGFYQGPVNGRWSADSEAALNAFGGLNTFFGAATQTIGNSLVINGPLADYIVQGFKRGTLNSAPDAL